MPCQTERVIAFGGFAELAGVTIRALHYYDRTGLLTPVRTAAGYRVYFPKDLERLQQIMALRFLGMPLRRIRQVLERAPLELAEALRLQRKSIEDKQPGWIASFGRSARLKTQSSRESCPIRRFSGKSSR